MNEKPIPTNAAASEPQAPAVFLKTDKTNSFETSIQTPAGVLSLNLDSGSAATTEHKQTLAVNAGGTNGLAPRDSSGTSGKFFNQLKGVPIEYLIATPLIAAARSNLALAEVMTEFIDEIGFDDKGATRAVTFDLTREFQDPVTAVYSPQTIKVSAPLLALVPLPALLIQSVTVDLTVEISNAVKRNDITTTKAELNIGADWGWGNASFTGSYTNTQDNTRSTNQAAKYEVKVNAQQQALPEGMSRLMDVFASTITPIPAKTS